MAACLQIAVTIMKAILTVCGLIWTKAPCTLWGITFSVLGDKNGRQKPNSTGGIESDIPLHDTRQDCQHYRSLDKLNV